MKEASDLRVPENPILIVDDEKPALTSMNISLQIAGLTNLRTCSDARVVHAMLRSETYSLVLLDLNMPFVSGHQILQQSASLDDPPPIVVVSASSDATDIAKCQSEGAADFLRKPVDRDRLIEAVRAALSRRESDREMRPFG